MCVNSYKQYRILLNNHLYTDRLKYCTYTIFFNSKDFLQLYFSNFITFTNQNIIKQLRVSRSPVLIKLLFQAIQLWSFLLKLLPMFWSQLWVPSSVKVFDKQKVFWVWWRKHFYWSWPPQLRPKHLTEVLTEMIMAQ